MGRMNKDIPNIHYEVRVLLRRAHLSIVELEKGVTKDRHGRTLTAEIRVAARQSFVDLNSIAIERKRRHPSVN